MGQNPSREFVLTGIPFLAVEQTCARHLQSSQASKPNNFNVPCRTFHAGLNINFVESVNALTRFNVPCRTKHQFIEVMLDQTATVFQACQIHLHYIAPNLSFLFAVESAVETVRMTDALLQQPLHREVAAQHQIAETFRIIQSHGEQVGIENLM